MYILGISCYYHNSAVCILKDGSILTAVEEERFSRKKFDDRFPISAIDYCMRVAKITPENLDCIAFYDKSILKFDRLLDNYIAYAPRGLRSFLDVMPKWLHKRLWIKDEIKKHLKGFDGKIVFPEHHLSHAAYSFFSSPFTKSAILTVDGIGEWTTTSYGTANNTTIKLTHNIEWPHSLGMFYSAFTYFLGFKVNDGEHKLMGLASYGKPKYYDLIMDELINVNENGSFHLNMKYFAYAYDKIMISKKFGELFGIDVREEDSKIEPIHYDIASSAQLVLEETLLKMANHVYKETKEKNLCLGGGVLLNAAANYRILKEGPFDHIYIPPSPGDGGSACGCAMYAYHLLHTWRRAIRRDRQIGPRGP